MRTRRNGGRSRWVLAGVIVGVMGVSACDSKGGRTDYSNSPDSGAAAPATQLDTSLSRTYPDSTAGGPQRTGTRGVTGDTLSTRGRPAGTGVPTRDTTRPRP
jgi:hypothetical protein